MAWGKPDKLEFAASQLVAALGYVGAGALGRGAHGVPARGPGAGGARAAARSGAAARAVRFVSQAQPGWTGRSQYGLAECLPSGSGQRLVVLVSDLLTPEGMASGLDTLRRPA